MRYARLWRRFLAQTIDWIALLSIYIVLFLIAIQSAWALAAFPLLFLATLYWYNVFMVTRHRGTFGKRLLGLEVRMANGEPLSVAAARARYSVWLFLFAVSGSRVSFSAVSVGDQWNQSWSLAEMAIVINQHMPPWSVTADIMNVIWISLSILTILLNKEDRALHDLVADTSVHKLQVIEKPEYAWECLVCESKNSAAKEFCMECGCPSHVNGSELERRMMEYKANEQLKKGA